MLTQFHLCYLWQDVCQSPLRAAADLDRQGVDAEVKIGDERIALSVKKFTWRREAQGGNRFGERKRDHTWYAMVEVPYLVEPPSEWKERAERARKDQTRAENQRNYELTGRLLRRLDNGFVVFQEDYAVSVEKLLHSIHEQGRLVTWQETVAYCLNNLNPA